MKPWQSLVKYGAIAFAVILIANIAVGAISLIGLLFGLSSSGTLQEPTVNEIKEEIEVLDIEISAAALTIKTENVDHITVTTNLKDLKVNEKNGKLTVKEKQRLFNVTYSDAYIEIICPMPKGIGDSVQYISSAEKSFKKVEIDTGAGKLVIEGFYVDRFDLDLGAGEAFLKHLYAYDADIEGGAGTLDIEYSSFEKLDLDMGVGELKMYSSFGEAEIDVGVGEADIKLAGHKDDYKLILSKGIGEIKVNGDRVGNGTIGNGEYKLKLSGGIGDINITFSRGSEAE